jgi:hypothetical protein
MSIKAHWLDTATLPTGPDAVKYLTEREVPVTLAADIVAQVFARPVWKAVDTQPDGMTYWVGGLLGSAEIVIRPVIYTSEGE